MESKFNVKKIAATRLRELLVWFFIVVGLLLVGISFLPGLSTDVRTLLRSLGLSLAPAGVVSIILSRFASSITEALLRESVETTIDQSLQEHMRQINTTVQDGLGEIDKTVKIGIDKIEREMESIAPLFSASLNLGLANVTNNRGKALEYFAWFLDAEIGKAIKGEASQIWIVSSSIKGFLETNTEHFDGRGMMEKIARCNCDLRIMMTDPAKADLRAQQERRANGEIPQEVEMNLSYLKRIGVKRTSVRYYPGTPTVFAIATSDRMLLNPYPYQREAFRCFSLIVQKTIDPESDIYHQYIRYHFDEPWKRACDLSVDFWDSL